MAVDKKYIERSEKYFPAIRKVAGWSGRELAKRLDISRCTIVRLESGVIEMNAVYYLAITKLYEEEALKTKNEDLMKVYDFFIRRDDISEEAKEILKSKIDMDFRRRTRLKRGKPLSIKPVSSSELFSFDDSEMLANIC